MRKSIGIMSNQFELESSGVVVEPTEELWWCSGGVAVVNDYGGRLRENTQLVCVKKKRMRKK